MNLHYSYLSRINKTCWQDLLHMSRKDNIWLWLCWFLSVYFDQTILIILRTVCSLCVWATNIQMKQEPCTLLAKRFCQGNIVSQSAAFFCQTAFAPSCTDALVVHSHYTSARQAFTSFTINVISYTIHSLWQFVLSNNIFPLSNHVVTDATYTSYGMDGRGGKEFQ